MMAESAPRNGAEPDAAVLAAMVGSGERAASAAAEKGAAFVVVDGECSGGGDDDGGSDREGEKVCRICHLSHGGGEDGSSELTRLGCGCKGELGVAHRHCAEAWFRVRGNRCCEICGATAKNITSGIDIRFMEEGHERREWNSGNSSENAERSGCCWRRQPFCNFLMACLIIAFILMWFFRVTYLPAFGPGDLKVSEPRTFMPNEENRLRSRH